MHIICAKCGTPQQQWRMQGQEGVRGFDGKRYCSQGCAEAATSERVNKTLQGTSAPRLHKTPT